MGSILVTGAAGFIGSHTCDQLLAAGHQVAGVDNFRTGKRANLQGALAQKRFGFFEVDVTDTAKFAAVVAETRPAAIIHLAALVSVPESFADPAGNFRLNLQATQIVAEIASKHDVKRVVFASSAAVYGDPGEAPAGATRELRPMSPYGGAKLASEILLLSQAKGFGFTARCQRYFNVFGPRQDPSSPYSGVISIFCQRMQAGQAPTIFGDGGQTRDFISVHDVARANLLAATLPGLQSGVSEIATGRATSLNQLAAMLRQLIPSAPPPVRAAGREGDIRHSLGSPDAARRELGFTAAVAVEAGLAELLAHAR
jgi:UDP-glucose 4-epimerase